MRCRDVPGIVSKVTDCIVSHGTNLTSVDMHIEKNPHSEDGSDVFLCRFGMEKQKRTNAFESDFVSLLAKFSDASASLKMLDGRRVDFRGPQRIGNSAAGPSLMQMVRDSGQSPRMGILVSKTEHCVLELLRRIRDGELNVSVPFVLGNHQPSSHLAAALQELKVPFYHVPTPPPTAGGAGLVSEGGAWKPWEAAIKDVLEAPGHETDFLVLARYMRVLSGGFLSWYEAGGGGGAGADGCGSFVVKRPIVNIHHGLLPSFKGAAPYAQAHKAGVKLIGATAHFVTEELDEGPIIEQQVRQVSHRDTLLTLRLKSQTLEAAALADAVRYLVQNRVLRVGGRVVVLS